MRNPSAKITTETPLLKFWIMTICWVVVMGLAAPIPLSAEPIQPFEYMLGYYNSRTDEGDTFFVEGKAPVYADALVNAKVVLEVVALINANRKRAGRTPLVINAILNHVAQAHSNAMRDRNCFAHQCPGERSPDARACVAGFKPYSIKAFAPDPVGISSGGPPPGKRGCFVAEVIAAGYPNAASVVNAWMNSPGHHAIIMHPSLREIGVGVAYGGLYRTYWTADLGIQRGKAYAFINNDDPSTTDQRVTLRLTDEDMQTSDGTTGRFREVMISNDPDFTDAHWEPYSPIMWWILTDGIGPKTVYVKVKDYSGNEILAGDIIFLNPQMD